MPLSLKSAARSILGAIPLPVYRALIRRDVVVFLYHVVGPPDLAHVRHLYRYKSPEAFEADVIGLARRFRLVSYDEIATGEARSGRPVAHLTFDDGYAECHALARPILLKRGVPCTFFLTTELIDNRSMFHRNKASLCIETLFECPDREASALLCDLGRRLGRPLTDRDAFRRWVLSLPAQEEARIDEVCGLLRLDVPAYLRNRQPYLSTDQIRRLAAEGFTIGAPRRRHVPLGILSDSAARDEIVGSCRTIQGLTGRDRVPFAFPHSADGVSRLFLRSLVGAHPVV